MRATSHRRGTLATPVCPLTRGCRRQHAVPLGPAGMTVPTPTGRSLSFFALTDECGHHPVLLQPALLCRRPVDRVRVHPPGGCTLADKVALSSEAAWVVSRSSQRQRHGMHSFCTMLNSPPRHGICSPPTEDPHQCPVWLPAHVQHALPLLQAEASPPCFFPMRR